MEKLFFSTDNLPADLNERSRVSAWRHFIGEVYGVHALSLLPDRPLRQTVEGVRLDGLDVVQMQGTTCQVKWMMRDISQPPEFFLCLNRTPMLFSQHQRDVELPADAATFGSCVERGEFRWRGGSAESLIVIPPQARLQELVADVEDLMAKPLHDSAALRHLRRYAAIVPGPDDFRACPDLAQPVARTVMDLVVLALGAGGDAAELARVRGLRAARLQQIIAEIRANFSDPAFSTHTLAGKLGVTQRYVQRLLYETGSTFHDRVLELRLQRARAMLTDPRYDRLKVTEIAGACGFNEIPYFNRCFRRRFGDTPSRRRSIAARASAR
jgi:AraC-like DNA-binding protein